LAIEDWGLIDDRQLMIGRAATVNQPSQINLQSSIANRQ
jgi:hypothetical protein